MDLPTVLCLAHDPRLIVNLESRAFNVLQAVSDLEAMNLYQRNKSKVEAIIVDHGMSELSSLILVKTLRYLDYKGVIWVLLDRISMNDFQNYQACGVACYWQKPEFYTLMATLLWYQLIDLSSSDCGSVVRETGAYRQISG